MRSLYALTFLLLATVMLPCQTTAPTPSVPTPKQGEQKTPDPVDALQTLQSLTKDISAKKTEIRDLEQVFRDARDKPKQEELGAKLKSLRDELAKFERDFESIATGLDIEAFLQDSQEPFQLAKDLELLMQPLVQQLKELSKEPRQIEQLRNEVESRNQKAEFATRAIQHVQGLLERGPEPALAEDLQDLKRRWQRTLQEAKNKAEVAQLQLEGKLKQRRSLLISSQELVGGFFRNRGLNLVLAFGAFLAVLLGMRFCSRPIRRLATKRRGKPSPPLYARLLRFVFYVATILAAVIAALLVLYAAGDWLLLGVAALMLLGLIWASKNTLPKLLDQVYLMLNLGAVREGERIVFNDVAWRIDSLNVYTRLVNPALAGGTLRLPIRHLVGMHSRPIAEKEMWFPSNEGDWISVGDVRGRVVSQTPETVQIVKLGGARVTYKTGAFLEASPVNLSANFRVRVTFGVDYQHQRIVTTTIPAKMQAALHDALVAMIGEDNLIHLGVEFKAAGASSLDVEVLADLSGAVASRYDALQRAIQRILVDSCNANGWVIPFTQITLHQAKSA